MRERNGIVFLIFIPKLNNYEDWEYFSLEYLNTDS